MPDVDKKDKGWRIAHYIFWDVFSGWLPTKPSQIVYAV